MIKSNPLFHDSTVTQGSNVQTQFEVINLPDLDENILVCLKLTVDDKLRFIEMTPKTDGVFHTSAWIEHRKKIAYQFFTQTKDGELIQATPVKEALALHTIVGKWKPLENENWKEDFKAAPEFAAPEMTFVEPQKKEATEDFLDGLIDKWDL
jgi:hypothetical protein